MEMLCGNRQEYPINASQHDTDPAGRHVRILQHKRSHPCRTSKGDSVKLVSEDEGVALILELGAAASLGFDLEMPWAGLFLRFIPPWTEWA